MIYLKQTLNQQASNTRRHLFIQQVDQWEYESIQKIKQAAEEIRQLISIHINENIIPTKEKLDQLTQQLKHAREQDNAIEADILRARAPRDDQKDVPSRPVSRNLLSRPVLSRFSIICLSRPVPPHELFVPSR